MLDKLAKNIVVFFSTVILLTCTIISMFFIATVKNFDENVMIKLTTSVGLICYLAIDFIIVFGIKKLEDKVKISKKINKESSTDYSNMYLCGSFCILGKNF